MRTHGVALLLLLVLSVARHGFAAPEIFSFDPTTGPAGTVLTVRGKGLETTTHVIFSVGRTFKLARFKVVSDRALEVTAPEYFQGTSVATVAVMTRSGTTVAMPATARTVREPIRDQGARGVGFLHVLDGGSVTSANDIALVEGGGIIDNSYLPGMHFVKRGGTLIDYSNPNGIVIHERGAIFGPKFLDRSSETFGSITLLEVPSVSVSPGVEPFTYESPPWPDPAQAPARLPKVQSISPESAVFGDIITLHGQGFAHTLSVQAVPVPGGHQVPTGFRIVSDSVLKVEVPDRTVVGPQLWIVLTTEGLTVTVPRGGGIQFVRTNSHGVGHIVHERVINWVAPGEIAKPSSLSTAFVEHGGLITGIAGGVVFVQSGGRIADFGGVSGLYYEPGLILPANLQKARGVHEVPSLLPSFLPYLFVAQAGPNLRDPEQPSAHSVGLHARRSHHLPAKPSHR